MFPGERIRLTDLIRIIGQRGPQLSFSPYVLPIAQPLLFREDAYDTNQKIM